MSLNIPTSLKKEFKVGFNEYIDKMGRKIQVNLEPYSVKCPNCLFDNIQNSSTNNWDSNFLRPVTIFPTTGFASTVYPQPFNVVTASGVQYNPSIPNPRVLNTAVCPVCAGAGVLTSPNSICIKAVVTENEVSRGVDSPGFEDLPAGRDGMQITRLKTYEKHYPICRDAKSFLIDGVTYKVEVPAYLKGLGSKHITQLYLSTTQVDSSVDTGYDADPRINVAEQGQVSNQASVVTPTVPPITSGDDIW